MLIASWISDFCCWMSRSCCYFEIRNHFRALGWRRMPHSVLLGLILPRLPVCSLHPDFSISSLDPCLPPTPETSGSQPLVCIRRPGELTEMHSPPSPSFDPAGLGICIVNKPLRGWVGVSLWRSGSGRDALWGARFQTLRVTASTHWASTLCFFAGGSPSSPTHLKCI